jgi:hypothetical protein
MAELTDLSDLINKSTSSTAQNVFYHKTGRIAGVAATTLTAGRNATLWRYDGQPAGGAIPSTEIVCTSATPGALPFVSATGGRETFMTQAWATALVGGTLMVYDRLYHKGSFNATSTAEQIVQGDTPSVNIDRNISGYGNFAFIEIHDTIGTTARTITMSYTNELGVTGRTSVATTIGSTGFREITRCILLTLQSGDMGIRSIKSVTIAGGTTGTAGNFSVVIGRMLGYVGIGAPGSPGWRDYVSGLPGIPKLDPTSCISLLWSPTTTTVPEIYGGYSIVES